MAEKRDVIEIDFLQILRSLWRRMWIIALASLILGAAAFAYTYYLIKPLYQSGVKMYVNNSSVSVGNTTFSISSSELTAAQSLVETYIVILDTRATLNDVIEKAGLPYNFEELGKMISASSVNGTEIFEITVTGENPKEAELIANTIAGILPGKISDVVDGSNVRVVDYAVAASRHSYPDIAINTMIGVLAGFALSIAIIIICEMFNEIISSEDYLMQTYTDIPLLAVIPDLGIVMGRRKYGVYMGK